MKILGPLGSSVVSKAPLPDEPSPDPGSISTALLLPLDVNDKSELSSGTTTDANDDEDCEEAVVVLVLVAPSAMGCFGTNILFLIELAELPGVDNTRDEYTMEGMAAGKSSANTAK